MCKSRNARGSRILQTVAELQTKDQRETAGEEEDEEAVALGSRGGRVGDATPKHLGVDAHST